MSDARLIEEAWFGTKSYQPYQLRLLILRLAKALEAHVDGKDDV